MSFIVGNKTFRGGTHVMGILNVTDNSFFAGSRVSADNIVARALQMAEDGAEIIDVGAQSTSPKAPLISEIEERSILLPALEKLLAVKDLPPISVDTFYCGVAEDALGLGASMINDVSGLSDVSIAKAVAKYGASICIMHNRRQSKVQNLWLDKQTGLSRAAQQAQKCGVDEDKIIIDGGIGFNLSHAEDKELLLGYDRLSVLGYPLLLGTSRKSFLGGEPETRLTATLDTTKLAVEQKILFVRVHDVKENKLVVDAYER